MWNFVRHDKCCQLSWHHENAKTSHPSMGKVSCLHAKRHVALICYAFPSLFNELLRRCCFAWCENGSWKTHAKCVSTFLETTRLKSQSIRSFSKPKVSKSMELKGAQNDSKSSEICKILGSFFGWSLKIAFKEKRSRSQMTPLSSRSSKQSHVLIES